MSTEAKLSPYVKGLELAESGKHEEALVYMQEHLKENPDDAEAINDVGAVLYCLERTFEAIEHFTKSIKVDNDFGEAYWNLVEAYLSCGKPEKASSLFENMARLEILNADAANRTANQFLEQDNMGSAIEMMMMSLELSKNQDILLPMLEVIRSKRPKVAFFGLPDNDDFYGFTNQRFSTESFSSKNHDQLPDLINWCDIAWFDSDNESLTRVSSLPAACKIVVKLNNLNDKQANININKIDKLVMAADDAESGGDKLSSLQKSGKLVIIVPKDTNKQLNQVLLDLEEEIQL